MESQIEKAETAAARNDMRTVYQITKRVTGGFFLNSGPIKARYGRLLSRNIFIKC